MLILLGGPSCQLMIKRLKREIADLKDQIRELKSGSGGYYGDGDDSSNQASGATDISSLGSWPAYLAMQ